jgi:hypothetical protein
VKEQAVEEYTGPLAPYVVRVPLARARAILNAEGAKEVAIPGSRPSSELELWVRDYFRREPLIREKRGLFWIGGLKPEDETKWFWVNAELIVYGATEPDASVTFQGKPIELRPDGTFSMRFALPDGVQVMPIRATSADRIDDRVITPIVSRETK